MTDLDPVCIVPARGTEPGLPKQNFKELDGEPLVAHTIDSALACEPIDPVYVSTESEALATLARRQGAQVPFLRPERLAAPDTLLHEVVSHALAELHAGGHETIAADTPVVVLQSNVPFRRPRDIEVALETFERGHEAVISVVEESAFYWRREVDRLDPQFEKRDTRAELESFYRETGSINVTTPRLLERGTRVGDHPGYVVTDRLSALAVDSVVDLWMAERLATGPQVVFRVDGGDGVGMGHVSRCLTLADELQATLRCEIVFVSDAAHTAGVEAIREAGYEVDAVENASLTAVEARQPDIVFLDVLDTDPDRVRALHEAAAAVVNLEDRAGGIEHADFTVNALHADADGHTHTHLAGPEYFVLREEFEACEPTVEECVERVLLTFGGSDPQGLSRDAYRAVAGLDDDREYRLVLGPDFDDDRRLEPALENCPEIATVEDPVMSEQMAWADIAVSSGGRTAYELVATGTPTLIVAQNDREHARMRALTRQDVVEYVGHGDSVTPEDLAAAIQDLATDYERRRAYSERGRAFVDGNGTRRILDLVHDVLVG